MGRDPIEWLRRDNGLLIPDLIIQLDAAPDQLSGRDNYGFKEGETQEFQLTARSALHFLRNVLNIDWVLLSALRDQETLSNLILHFVMLWFEDIIE